MSLDLYLSHPPCETCGHQEDRLNFNITYNLSPMWYHLYPNDEEILPIDAWKASESLPIIERAITAFIENKAHLCTLEASNGWGTWGNFIQTLRDMRDACEKYPDLFWECSR